MGQQAIVAKRAVDRIRGGHLWIYRSDVVSVNGAAPGSVVSILDENGRFQGRAMFSDRSEITLRILTLRDEQIDREWWRRRLRAAFQRRRNIGPDTDSYRLVYAEGDLLPSLIIDRYRDVLVLQTLSQGTEHFKDLIVSLLIEELEPRAIIERNDVKVRKLEGLEMSTGVLFGDAPQELEISQDGLRFVVHPLAGQKTGSFLDQRENRIAAKNQASGRGLDCFTFNGAFALHLSARCESVIGVDISGEAIKAAKRNAALNQCENVSFIESNVFDTLREMESSGERFDTIVLDPPAFAKNRGSVHAAIRGYKEINLRALKLLNTGGVLISCTCSYHMSESMFLEVIADAAVDSKRRVQLVEKRMQSSDHPVLVNVPETYYLKCVIVRVLE
ncbi:MAG: rRNA (cytosine1962-C5)-methyltransferase [Blastocatellia bacterium]|jgi:23S rRNA (cytosine1962-C5)-methyltransferase|nr:rRNA (cytosine1962-C5)-methyltransferase [Blastocatellia bacterium]